MDNELGCHLCGLSSYLANSRVVVARPGLVVFAKFPDSSTNFDNIAPISAPSRKRIFVH